MAVVVLWPEYRGVSVVRESIKGDIALIDINWSDIFPIDEILCNNMPYNTQEEGKTKNYHDKLENLIVLNNQKLGQNGVAFMVILIFQILFELCIVKVSYNILEVLYLY